MPTTSFRTPRYIPSASLTMLRYSYFSSSDPFLQQLLSPSVVSEESLQPQREFIQHSHSFYTHRSCQLPPTGFSPVCFTPDRFPLHSTHSSADTWTESGLQLAANSWCWYCWYWLHTRLPGGTSSAGKVRLVLWKDNQAFSIQFEIAAIVYSNKHFFPHSMYNTSFNANNSSALLSCGKKTFSFTVLSRKYNLIYTSRWWCDGISRVTWSSNGRHYQSFIPNHCLVRQNRGELSLECHGVCSGLQS